MMARLFKSTPRFGGGVRRLPLRAPRLVRRTPSPEPPKRAVRLPRRLIGIIIFGLILYSLFLSPAFEIRAITIEGNREVREELLLEALPPRLNFFRLSSRRLETDLRAISPVIASVKVYRGFPSALKIVVVEHQGEVVWRSTEGQFLVDDRGRIHESIETSPEGRPVVVHDLRTLPVKVGDEVMAAESIVFVKEAVSRAPVVLGQPLGEFQVYEATFDLDAMLEGGRKVRLDATRDPSVQLQALKRILDNFGPQIKEYVDLRVEGWAYFK